MMTKLRALIEAADLDARDAHCYGGLFLVGCGAALYAPPASLIVVGAALFFLALRRA